MKLIFSIAIVFGLLAGISSAAPAVNADKLVTDRAPKVSLQSAVPAGSVFPASGGWGGFAQVKGANFGMAEGVRVFWYPDDDDSQAPTMHQTATLRGHNGPDEITIQIPADPARSGWSGDFANGVLRIYILMPGQSQPLLAAKYTLGNGVVGKDMGQAAKTNIPAQSSTTQASTSQPSGGITPHPVSGTPQGAQVAGSEIATSQAGIGGAPGVTQMNLPGAAGRELSTQNMEGAGTTIVAVSGVTATSLMVEWKPVAGASGYTLHAAAQGLNLTIDGVEVRQPSSLVNDMSASLAGLAPGVKHSIWVVVNYPNGKRGTSPMKDVMMASAENPQDFKAVSIGPGAVRLEWQAVPGATGYTVQGSNLPRMQTADTAVAVTNLSPATHEWTVIAVYPGGLYNDLNPSRVSATINPEGGTAAAAGSKYRVTLVGFTANRSTWDNALQLDGKGDEVYVSTSVRFVDAEGHSVLGDVDPEIRSHTYGDILFQGQPDRRVGGQASDQGGFADGSNYPAVPWLGEPNPTDPRSIPMVLWSGTLTQGQNAVLITPTLWEYDGSQLGSIFQDWTTWAGRVANIFANPQQFMQVAGAQVPATIDLGGMGAGLAIDFQESILGSDGDRPIGMRSENGHATFKPKTIVFTQKVAETLLSQNIGAFPKGIYPISYQDDPKWRGDYTVYLRVDRLP